MRWFMDQFDSPGAASERKACRLSPIDAGGDAPVEAAFSWRDGQSGAQSAKLPGPNRKPPLAAKERRAAKPQSGGPASMQRRRDRGETQSRTVEHRARQSPNGLPTSAFLSDLRVSALNSTVSGMRVSRAFAAPLRGVFLRQFHFGIRAQPRPPFSSAGSHLQPIPQTP